MDMSYDLVVKDMAGDSVRFFITLGNAGVTDYSLTSGHGDMDSGEIVINQNHPAGDAYSPRYIKNVYLMKYENKKVVKKTFLFSYDRRIDATYDPGCVNQCRGSVSIAGERTLLSFNNSAKILFFNEYDNSDCVTPVQRQIIIRSAEPNDSVRELEKISIDTSIANIEQRLGVDSLTVNFFLATGAEITRSYFIGSSPTAVKLSAIRASSLQKFSRQNSVYSIDGRRIANTSRAAYGLNIVRLQNGTIVKSIWLR
jgi:hypothetical protein